MTDIDINTIKTVLTHIFGECAVTPNDEEQALYIEVKQACVVMMQEPIELESISGPREVMGWVVGVDDDEGMFEELAGSESIWEVLSYAADELSDQMIENLRWNAHAQEVAADA
jgi:hypothetical protein